MLHVVSFRWAFCEDLCYSRSQSVDKVNLVCKLGVVYFGLIFFVANACLRHKSPARPSSQSTWSVVCSIARVQLFLDHTYPCILTETTAKLVKFILIAFLFLVWKTRAEQHLSVCNCLCRPANWRHRETA